MVGRTKDGLGVVLLTKDECEKGSRARMAYQWIDCLRIVQQLFKRFLKNNRHSDIAKETCFFKWSLGMMRRHKDV
jgi:hypothetical protein